jgi:hypothetical protein
VTEHQDPAELLHSYLQTDAAPRSQQFQSFVQALRCVAARQGPDVAAGWARRAVSPFLDYTSLVKLRRLLLPEKRSQERVPAASGTLRLAILGGPTTIQLRQLLEIFLAGEGIAAEIYESEYGLFRQELMNPSPELEAFAPQVILLACATSCDFRTLIATTPTYRDWPTRRWLPGPVCGSRPIRAGMPR